MVNLKMCACAEERAILRQSARNTEARSVTWRLKGIILLVF